ncbi:MAG: formylglycine-generating enzyme family protein [Candidatus Competibacter sp.]|nr:formylglycine-generating enzyme family protein [Candidatus Competibacter sp.]
MNARKLFAALRWLDYQPAVINIILGVTTGLMLGELLFQTSPLMAGVGSVALLGGAVVLAWSGEPIAVLVRPTPTSPPSPPVGPKLEPKPEPPPLVELVDIPAGAFFMGSDEYDSERPIHEVRISAFRCMRFPVTRRLYQDMMGKDLGWPEGEADDRPVNQVSWYDAIEFCNRLSEREGLTPAYRRSGNNVSWDATADGYRLLTEAEWEYACRAGTRTRYSFGDDEGKLGEYVWYARNSDGAPHPVGTLKPNPWGLYDMHGNVWEWCWDWYGFYPSESQPDPMGPPAGNSRVLRGGSFGGAGFLRSAGRGWNWPEVGNQGDGFRCARGPRRQP